MDGGARTATKYYFFGGQRIAQKVGTGVLTYLHTDHLSSVLETTGVAGEKRFTAFGATRTGTIPTDYGYTGQHHDSTGLLYYKARYYDPTSGQFVSPDTVVPDPSNVYDYNRYLYARGNPLGYSDPSGHCTEGFGDEDFECFYLAQQIFRQYPNQDWDLLAGSSIESLRDVIAQLSAESQVPQSQGMIKSAVARYLSGALPGQGAEGAGISGSVGAGIDVVANWGFYADENGNIVLSADSAGIGISPGVNADAGAFVTRFPNASSVDIYNGRAYNVGVTGGKRGTVGVEANWAQDPSSGDWIIGQTYTLGVSPVKINIPILRSSAVEVYVNATDADFTYALRLNIYSLLGLERP